MKKITIGRGNDCSITIGDTTDIVSRHHAVIAFNFWGKMRIYDTSSNGTFVNNERLQKGEARLITRKDSINFGHVWDLDWATVRDPYKQTRIFSILGIVIAIVATALIIFFVANKKTQYIEKTKPVVEQNVSTPTTLKEDAHKTTSVQTIHTQKATTKKANKNRVATVKTQSTDSIAEYKGNKKDGTDTKVQKGKNVSPIIY